MTFIGFVADKKDENDFEKVLKSCLDKMSIKVVAVAINEKSIKNIKNIKFETIIIDRNIKEQFQQELKEILKIAKYLIINSDTVNIEKFQNMNLNAITYGFGNKCTVTTSSVEEENTLICIQRSIRNLKNIEIEPQEVRMNTDEAMENQYLNMAAQIIEMIYQNS